MGLFTNKKKTCPICGEPTPLMFSTKVEDVPICKECSKKIFLPEGKLEEMTMDDFREYMKFYEENQVLRDKFSPTYEYSVGFSWMTVKLDPVNGLFALHGADNALVFEKSCIETYRILEDDNPLYQGNKKAIKFFESSVPEIVRGMSGQIMQFQSELRRYEMMERMERMHEEARRDDDDSNRSYTRPYIPRPTFDVPEPFRNFKVRVRLEHPYWQGIHQGKIGAPTFSNYDPDIEQYLNDYYRTRDSLYELALEFKRLVNPQSKEIYDKDKGAGDSEVSATAPAEKVAPTENVVEEIKKYKDLFDAGIITEEEFVAKKKQLMGI